MLQTTSINTTTQTLNTGMQGSTLSLATGGISQGISLALESIFKINVFEEFGKVLKYGLSSWGASTTPSQTLSSVVPHLETTVKNALAQLNDNNAGEILTFLDGFFEFHYTGSKHSLEHHSRARSTKEAHTQAMQVTKELKSKVMNPLLAEIKKYNTVSYKTVSKDFNEIQNNPFVWHDGAIFDTSHKYMVSYKEYTVKSKGLLSDIIGGIDNAVNDNNLTDEGVKTQLASMSWISIILSIALALGMYLKPKGNSKKLKKYNHKFKPKKPKK